ncbi:MAG: prolyl oligopeptidase family serine peptidase [Planctomycetota bacterium]|nr:prolyl oligopeptidase family serine peptidase [Planctomycetota bacterium]
MKYAFILFVCGFGCPTEALAETQAAGASSPKSADAKSVQDADAITTLSESYFSEAEGRRQGFQVVLPPGFQSDRKYPLFVQVFGGSDLLPTRERPFIRVRPSGRGVWGYRSMSRYDVMQVIRRAKEAYHIDENRVYMTGTSAGATGIMHAAAQRPDVFAGVVPLVAFGNDLPLENFRNLPIRCEHGINDWTSAICNVRVQFQKLKPLDQDAVLNEHPTAGHGVRVPPPATMDWLFNLKRNPQTLHVVYSCEHPRDGRAYWVKIEEFVDPHAVARIDAKVNGNGVAVTTRNIRRLSLDVSTAPLGDNRQVTIDGDSVTITRTADPKWVTFAKEKNWRLLARVDTPKRRIYGAGAAANLFQGDPLLVVYGTGGDDAENRFLLQAANVLSHSGGPTFQAASVSFPVRADSKLGDLPLEKYNLLLVGTPENNSLLGRIASKLPYRIEDGALRAGDRKPLALNGSVLGFHYFNPEHPGRIIHVLSPYLDDAERNRFLRNPRKFLSGSEGFKMIDQADLLVRGVDLRIRREMQLDRNWRFIAYAGADKQAPDRFSDRAHLATAHMKVMQQAVEVDFAMWWGPEDKGLFGGYDFNWLPTFDPTSYTLADFAVRHRETETMTAVISGSELQDIFKRWIGTRELITWPTVTNETINVDRSYKIVIPMDMVPKLGIRRKVLSMVAAGPSILPAQVAAEIHRKVE